MFIDVRIVVDGVRGPRKQYDNSTTIRTICEENGIDIEYDDYLMLNGGYLYESRGDYDKPLKDFGCEVCALCKRHREDCRFC